MTIVSFYFTFIWETPSYGRWKVDRGSSKAIAPWRILDMQDRLLIRQQLRLGLERATMANVIAQIDNEMQTTKESEELNSVHPPLQSYKIEPMRFFLMEVPFVGGSKLLNLFISNSWRYNNITWCMNAPWKKPPVLDHVCERIPSKRRATVHQVEQTFGEGRCGGIRMIWDFSLIDEILLLSRKRFLLVTVLRHPVYRVVNAYYGSAAHNVTSLKEFALSEEPHFQKYGSRNHQVRQLAGVLVGCSQYSLIEKSYIHANVLSIAKRNVASFDVIGIYEQMEETLRYFQYRFKWYSHVFLAADLLESTRSRSHMITSLSTEDYEFIAEANNLEMQLYEYAKELFQKQLEQTM